MKKNLIKDYAAKTKEELQAMLVKEQEELVKMKLYRRVKKEKNLRAVFHKRKNIAVIKTIIREKELKNV